MTIVLKGGFETQDLRLDRIEQFDEASRDFPVTSVLPTRTLRSYTHRVGPNTDQLKEGACGGHGWTQWLMARPRPAQIPSPDRYALELYWAMQREDQWPGGAYPGADPVYSGTSVIAGAKVLGARGAVPVYRWGFGLNDLLLALGYVGPAVLGIPWYESMYEAPNGILTVSGEKVGGHCLLSYAVSVPRRTVKLRNSWGPGWGINGNAEIGWDALEALLHDRGEACIPTKAAAFSVTA